MDINNPERKPVINSKFTKGVIGFAKGFAIGYLISVGIFNPAHLYYERVLLGLAIGIGILLMLREVLCSEEDKREDRRVFLRTSFGVFFFIYFSTMGAYIIETAIFSSLFGIISAIRRRKRKKLASVECSSSVLRCQKKLTA